MKICVIGSINQDLSLRVPHFPLPGETVTGSEFVVLCGGKGANQAVAASRLGADVTMAACVGNDVQGDSLKQAIADEGICTVDIESTPVKSGTAIILVDDSGENSISLFRGANGLLDRNFVLNHKAAIESSDIVMLQLETPIDGVICAAETAKQYGKKVILDPAPALMLEDRLLRAVDILTPNETELAILCGTSCSTNDERIQAARSLIKRGVGCVINKIGKAGALIVTADGCDYIPGYKVNAIDTTAAGDTFNGALACALAKGLSMKECVLYANAAGALSTTRLGAQSAIPTAQECENLINSQKIKPEIC